MLYRHRRRHVHCAGMDVPAFKMTALARALQVLISGVALDNGTWHMPNTAVHMSLRMSIHMSAHTFLILCKHACIHVYTSVYTYGLCMPTHLSMHMSVHMFVLMCVHMSIHMCACTLKNMLCTLLHTCPHTCLHRRLRAFYTFMLPLLWLYTHAYMFLSAYLCTFTGSGVRRSDACVT